MRYLIAGAGPAGVIAAETLRRLDSGAEIGLIGSGSEPPYSRMAIPYYLSDRIPEQGTYLRPRSGHFQAAGIELLRDRVRSVDPGNARVELTSGQRLGYDRLLLATGSVPVAPPVPGLDQPGIHHCWTLTDARNIARLARPEARVVLLGAGFIGCIIMEALITRGVRLSVVEMGDRMVPRMLDPTAGRLLQRWCENKGVSVRTATRVTGVEKRTDGFTLQVDGASSITADLVVVAAGVRPNLDYLAGSGVRTAGGVLVDTHLATNIPGVFAAGDICEGLDWSTGRASVHAIQPTASEHGRVAALNMAGRPTRYPGSLIMNVLDTMGLISTSYGLWMGVPGGDDASLLDEPAYRYLRLQFDGDRLVGAVSLGLTEHVGVIRGLIQSRRRLGDWKQRLRRDPSRLMEAYIACAQAPASDWAGL